MGDMEILKTKNEPFVPKILWPAVIGFSLLHLMAIYGWYLLFVEGTFPTFIYGILLAYYEGFSITIGAHRFWSHRSFKAKLPLRLIFLVGHTISGQDCLWVWIRNHRQHHKYTDTDADPHNSKKGFFFSHMGWLMVEKHPEVVSKSRLVEMSDIKADPLIMFQKRHYIAMYFLFAILITVAIPCYFWNETIWNSFFLCYVTRFVTDLHLTWSVNSFAHIFGTRPYDKNIIPVENKYVAAFALGEGWHNYHHVFPWDCNAAELGRDYNLSSKVLAFLERIGQAYDLKKATKEMTMNRVRKYGDGTHPVY